MSKVLKGLQKNQADNAVEQHLQDLAKHIGSSDQINHFLKGVPTFVGAQSYDQINVPNGYCAIVNYITMKEANEGIFGHWICIDNRSPDHIIYFDPYGIAPDLGREVLHLPDTNNFTHFLEQSGKPITVNHHQYQDFIKFDESCSIWSCVAVLIPFDETIPPYNNPTPSAMRDLGLEQMFLSHTGTDANPSGGGLAQYYKRGLELLHKGKDYALNYLHKKGSSYLKESFPKYRLKDQQPLNFEQLIAEKGHHQIKTVNVGRHRIKQFEAVPGLTPYLKWQKEKVGQEAAAPTHASLMLELINPSTGQKEHVLLEKNERITVKRHQNYDKYLNEDTMDNIQRDVKDHLPLRDFINNGKEFVEGMGKDYHVYDLANSNCQHFGLAHIEGNAGHFHQGSLNKNEMNKVNENAESLVQQGNWLTQTGNSFFKHATDLAGWYKRLNGGSL